LLEYFLKAFIMPLQRKKKVVPEGLAAPEALASLKAGKGTAADKDKSPMVCLAIGAAGLTVGSESGAVSTFDASTGAFNSSIKQAHEGHVNCIAQSPIGLVSGGNDGCVKVWASGKCKHTFRDLGGAIVGVSVHPCGDYAAAAGESGCWAFYDLAYGTCRQVFAQSAPLSTGVFHPDGLIFATADKGDSLQLWDLKNERPALKFSAGAGQITSVAFSENGYSIAAACGGVASIFDLRKLAKSQVSAANSLPTIQISAH
jgi:pre-mRNA-processing factor 19